jgi:hypothetical protein
VSDEVSTSALSSPAEIHTVTGHNDQALASDIEDLIECLLDEIQLNAEQPPQETWADLHQWVKRVADSCPKGCDLRDGLLRIARCLHRANCEAEVIWVPKDQFIDGEDLTARVSVPADGSNPARIERTDEVPCMFGAHFESLCEELKEQVICFRDSKPVTELRGRVGQAHIAHASIPDEPQTETLGQKPNALSAAPAKEPSAGRVKDKPTEADVEQVLHINGLRQDSHRPSNCSFWSSHGITDNDLRARAKASDGRIGKKEQEQPNGKVRMAYSVSDAIRTMWKEFKKDLKAEPSAALLKKSG